MFTRLSKNQLGILLALFGALMITPDTLFMRLSDMPVWVMLAWRGTEMGLVLLLVWLALHLLRLPSVTFATELARLTRLPGLLIIVTILTGGTSFTYAIAETSVAVVLFTIACAPLFAALFSSLFLGERTRLSTWLAMLACLAGIATAVSGGGDNIAGMPDRSVFIGASCGLLTAASLGMNFVLFRACPDVPLMPANGLGALLTGLTGLWFASKYSLFSGYPEMISVSGLIILPVSFLALTAATRLTNAANVSLLMLLETVLGPVWVWLGTGERPSALMIAGGVIVVGSLCVYISLSLRSHSHEGA